MKTLTSSTTKLLWSYIVIDPVTGALVSMTDNVNILKKEYSAPVTGSLQDK